MGPTDDLLAQAPASPLSQPVPPGLVAAALGGPQQFNPAQDSQQANAALGLSAVTSDDTDVKPNKLGAALGAAGGSLTRPRRAHQWVAPAEGPTAGQLNSTIQNQTGLIAQSSKAVKTRTGPAPKSMPVANANHPIDQNGAHVAAIQHLNAEIGKVSAQIAKVKAQRATRAKGK